MKRTLSLIALIAALMPLSPLTAWGDTTAYWVKGIVWNDETQTAEGWFDADKDRGANGWDDSNLCWAAACSNLVAWWQNQQEYEIEAPANLDEIWNQYRQTWANVGGHANLGLYWWLDGSYSKNGKTIPARDNGLSPDLGGYYSDYLASSPGFSQKVLDSDLKVLEIDRYSSARTLSETLVSYISNGYGVELTWALGSSSSGHSVTLWGVEYDETQGVITHFYLTDSDHDANTLTKTPVEITTIESNGRLYETLARRNEYGTLYYKAWSFTVLNSRLSNDIHYFNYQDSETHDIILQQSVNGKGYTLSGTQEVRDIVFDGSRGTQSRLLTVEGEHAAGTLFLNGAGVNTVNVTDASKLAVEQISGGQNLTKAGAGTLEIQGGTATGTLDIQAGVVLNKGALGEVKMANGSRLENGGTITVLTVGNGSVAEMKLTAANRETMAFTQATVEEGGTLKGSGKFGKVVLNSGGTLVVGNSPGYQDYQDSLTIYNAELVYSIDDALSWLDWAKEGDCGWGSGTYSTIDVHSNALTISNPEFTFALGENILERVAGSGDLMDALGRTLTFNLDLKLISGVNTMSNPYAVFEGYETYGEHTSFQLSEDDASLVAKGLTADITSQNLEYYIDGNDLYMRTGLNVTLAKAPSVPEPTTGTLGLLALASLVSRRRRK